MQLCRACCLVHQRYSYRGRTLLFVSYAFVVCGVGKREICFFGHTWWKFIILTREHDIKFHNGIDRDGRDKRIFFSFKVLQELFTSISIWNATERFYNCLKKTLSPASLKRIDCDQLEKDFVIFWRK